MNHKRAAGSPYDDQDEYDSPSSRGDVGAWQRDLRDGDRVILVNQENPEDNGAYVIDGRVIEREVGEHYDLDAARVEVGEDVREHVDYWKDLQRRMREEGAYPMGGVSAGWPPRTPSDGKVIWMRDGQQVTDPYVIDGRVIEREVGEHYDAPGGVIPVKQPPDWDKIYAQMYEED